MTCYLYKRYEVGPAEGRRELWKCQRRIRDTVEKRPWYKHKKWNSHSKLLGPWSCGAHQTVRNY